MAATGKRSKCGYKGQQKRSVIMDALYLDSINVNILSILGFYSIGANRVKGTQDLSVLFLNPATKSRKDPTGDIPTQRPALLRPHPCHPVLWEVL